MRNLLGTILVGLLIFGGAAEARKATHTAQMTPQTPPSSLQCPGGQPVWVNTRTHAFHTQGDKYYGSTKHGKFMCENDAQAAGFHLAGSKHAAKASSTVTH